MCIAWLYGRIRACKRSVAYVCAGCVYSVMVRLPDNCFNCLCNYDNLMIMWLNVKMNQEF